MLENVSSSWYFGKLPREQAESLLMSTATGTFIVRESDDNPSELSLSVLEGNDVKHYSIHQLDFIVRESDDNPSELSLSVLEGNDVKHYSIHQLDDGDST